MMFCKTLMPSLNFTFSVEQSEQLQNSTLKGLYQERLKNFNFQFFLEKAKILSFINLFKFGIHKHKVAIRQI